MVRFGLPSGTKTTRRAVAPLLVKSVRRSSRAPVSLSEPKDLSPLVEGQVGGDQDRPSPVSLTEELRAGLREWDEAKLVDDEQLEAGKPLLKVEQSSLVSGLDQLVDQRGGGCEADRQPTLAGCEPQAEGHMD